MDRRIGATVVAAVLAASAVAALAGVASAAPPEGPNGPPGRYFAVFDCSVAHPGAVAAEHSHAYNAQVSFVYTSAIKGYAAVIPNGKRVAECEAMGGSRTSPTTYPVEAVQPPGGTPPGNGRGGGGGGGTPPPQTLPTGVDRIDGEGKSPGGNAAVAVIDTGSGPHSDLNVMGGKNCSTGASYNDGNGHGTHVAGAIRAINNTTGVVGLPPGVPIYSVPCSNNAGSGSWSSIICGIDWVTGNRAALNIRVANMSLGGSTTENDSAGCTSSALHQAICNSVNAGVTYVAAAGNSAANFATFAPAPTTRSSRPRPCRTATASRSAREVPVRAAPGRRTTQRRHSRFLPRAPPTRDTRSPLRVCASSRRGQAAATTRSAGTRHRFPPRHRHGRAIAHRARRVHGDPSQHPLQAPQ